MARRHRDRFHPRAARWLALAACIAWPTAGSPARVAAAPEAASGTVRSDQGKVQAIVDELKAQLAMPHEITVAIVPENELLVSVATLKDRDRAFVISVEDRFLQGVTDEELRAIVAHELGHVWIFTHHPYLQTERLANKIAMRLVPRESLVRVYEKVWERGGVKGDLIRFLGE